MGLVSVSAIVKKIVSGGGTQRRDDLIRGIDAVGSAVRRSRNLNHERKSRTVRAIQELAAITRTHGAASVEDALASISESMMVPFDPSLITWNTFRLFEVEDSETAWTKWIASLLSPENGASLSRIAWRAFCDAVLQQRHEPKAEIELEAYALAKPEHWRAASDLPLRFGSVEREVADPELGRPDIVIDTPHLLVVLENKLDAGWHDGEETQAAKYRRFGLKHRNANQRLALVLLTKREDFELGIDGADFVCILYRNVARALRRNLRLELSIDRSASAMLALWPAILTVAAIEQDLLGLDIPSSVASARQRSWRAVGTLNEILSYLREEPP